MAVFQNKKEVITFLKSEMQMHYSLWLYVSIVLYTCSTTSDRWESSSNFCVSTRTRFGAGRKYWHDHPMFCEHGKYGFRRVASDRTTPNSKSRVGNKIVTFGGVP